MTYCVNKCNYDCKRKLKSYSEIKDGDAFGRLEGFPSYCPKAKGAPVDKTDAPYIFRRKVSE